MDRLHQATRVTENREEILKIYGEIKVIKSLILKSKLTMPYPLGPKTDLY